MPNVTSETDRKARFWLLFPEAVAAAPPPPPAAAAAALQEAAPGQENTMARKDGEAAHCAQKVPNVTSETDRKARFWLLFPEAVAAAPPPPPAAAAAALQDAAPGQENTVAWKDGEA